MSSSICSDSTTSCNDSMNITDQLNDELKCIKKKKKPVCHISSSSESLPEDNSNLTTDDHPYKCRPHKHHKTSETTDDCKEEVTECKEDNIYDVVSDLRVDILRILMLMQKVMNELSVQSKKIKKLSRKDNICASVVTNTCATSEEDLAKISREFDAKLETLKREIEEETRKIISNHTVTTKAVNIRHAKIPNLGNRLQ